MDYKTLTEEQLQEQLQLIMDEINRRNNLKEIPEQVDSLAKKYEELGGNKEELVHRIQDQQQQELNKGDYYVRLQRN